MKLINNEAETVLFYAFRYALGRKTGVVSEVVGIITNKWTDIPQTTRYQMKEEIKQAISLGIAGDECDIREWQAILELPERDQ